MSYPKHVLMGLKSSVSDVHQDLLEVENSHLISNPEVIDNVFTTSTSTASARNEPPARKEPPGLRKKDPTIETPVMEESVGRGTGTRYHRGRGRGVPSAGRGGSSRGRGRGGGSLPHKNPIISSLLGDDAEEGTSSTSSSTIQPNHPTTNKKKTYAENTKGSSRATQIDEVDSEDDSSDDSDIAIQNNKAKAAANENKLDIFARRRNVIAPTTTTTIRNPPNKTASDRYNRTDTDRFARPPDPPSKHYSSTSRYNTNNTKFENSSSNSDGGDKDGLELKHVASEPLNHNSSSRFQKDKKAPPNEVLKRTFSDPSESSLFYNSQSTSNKEPYNPSSRTSRFTNSRFNKKSYDPNESNFHSYRPAGEEKLLKPSFASQNDPYFKFIVKSPNHNSGFSHQSIPSHGSLFGPRLDEGKHKPPGEIGRKPISPQPDKNTSVKRVGHEDTWKHLTDLAVNPGGLSGKKSSSSNCSSNEYDNPRYPAPVPSSSSKLYDPHYGPPVPPSKLYSDTTPPERTRYHENVHMGDDKLYEERMPNNFTHYSSSDRRRPSPPSVSDPHLPYKNLDNKPPKSSSLHTMFPNHEPPAPTPQGKDYKIGVTKGEEVVLKKPDMTFVHSKETYRSLLCRILKDSKFGEGVEIKYLDGHVNKNAKLDDVIFEDDPKDIWYLTKPDEDLKKRSPENHSPVHQNNKVIDPAYEKKLRRRLENEIREKLEEELGNHYAMQWDLEKEANIKFNENLKKSHERDAKNWKREVQLLDKECSNQDKTIRSLEQSILEEKENFIRKNAQCSTLSQTIDRFSNENQQQKERIHELEKQNRKLQIEGTKNTGQKREADLENQLNQKKNYIDMLKATLIQKEKENEDLQLQRNELKLANGRLKKSLNMEEDWGGAKNNDSSPVAAKPVEAPKKPKKKKKKVDLKPKRPAKKASTGNPWSSPTTSKTTTKKPTSMASLAKKRTAKPTAFAPRRLPKPSTPSSSSRPSAPAIRKLSKPSASTLTSQTASFLDDWELPSSRKTVKGSKKREKTLDQQFGDKNSFNFAGENGKKKKKKKKKKK